MKKLKFLFLFITLFKFGIAQNLTSYQGEVILPEAKDWSFGIDGTQFIKNFKFDFLTSAQTITGKYFKDATTAYRFGLRLGYNNWTSKNYVTDRLAAASSSIAAYPATIATKENSWRKTASTIGLSGGIEKRRGKTRLQGLYGVEGGIYVSSSKDKFSYGNKLNPSPLELVAVDTADAMSSKAFGAANNIDNAPKIQGVSGSARITERKNGVAFSIGARVFAGAEFFVLPKMSIGGEFAWGFAYSLIGRSETTLESIGVSTVPGASTVPSVKQTSIDGSQSSSFSIDNSNAGILGGLSASLRLNVYF